MHSERINKLSSIFLTDLDVLDHLPEIKVCTGYRAEDGTVTSGRLPATMKEFSKVEAEYTTLKGWQKDTTQCKTLADLPTEAQSFVKFIEQKARIEVSYISTSADEDEGMIRTRMN
jgi:adenylosuccinate synthase